MAEPDTEVVKRWLAVALAGADPGRKKALAAHCGVRPQAVSGWLRTGRITKRNLEKAREFLGTGPSFTHKGMAAREPAPAGGFRWRFQKLDLAAINALAEKDLLRLELAWLAEAHHLGLQVTKTKRAAA